MKTPIDKHLIDNAITDFGIKDFSKATIREVVAIAVNAEKESGVEFIKLEMGVPGLPPCQHGIEAQKKAIEKGIPQIYPTLDGMPVLKEEASRFVKAFLNIDIKPQGCIPVCGSMQGTYASFIVASQIKGGKILFIDPGFPVQKQQCKVIGIDYETFDLYNYRGKNLGRKVEEYLSKGDIAAIIYSNPNNPSWVCLHEDELKIIGELATKYDVIVLEDLAYFAMDFRRHLGIPFEPPYQCSVANYTDNYILLISGSKAFSYAGERIGVACISDKIYSRVYPALEKRYGVGSFGAVFVHRVVYALTSGTSHSAQYAMAAMMKAASEGKYDFCKETSEYGRRARKLKDIFLKNGFHIVYDKDLDEEIADGFYFTIGYKNMSAGELSHELMYYGVSTINLSNTGSNQQGVRICTSFVKDNQYDILEKRMKIFNQNNK